MRDGLAQLAAHPHEVDHGTRRRVDPDRFSWCRLDLVDAELERRRIPHEHFDRRMVDRGKV
ncbi:MAG: hypothetical protein WAL50_04135 [Kineosporiaceae bacterium]